MIIHSTVKGVHGFKVGKESVYLKFGENDVDDALWARAKSAQPELLSLLKDKKLTEKAPAIKSKSTKPVSVDIK